MFREIITDFRDMFVEGRRAVIIFAMIFAAATGAAFCAHAVDGHIDSTVAARVTELEQAVAKDKRELRAAAFARADEQTAARLAPCLIALDMADESIWAYFSALRDERQAGKTAAGSHRVADERGAYGNYTSARDQCRVVAGRYGTAQIDE